MDDIKDFLNYRNPFLYFAIAAFSFGMASISPFVCGRNHRHHSCSHSNYNVKSSNTRCYNEKANLLEELADENGNGVLCNHEKLKMYGACGIADKPQEYALTLEDLERGIKNYQK